MNNNKPKKDVIGESTVIHVNKAFAIPVIIIFMSILVIFGIAWFGILGADAFIDSTVNPAIIENDPNAEEIDIMAVMNPPTSEQEAAKVYASFPTLDTEKIGSLMGAAFEAFPAHYFSDGWNSISANFEPFIQELGVWWNEDFYPAASESLSIVSDTVDTYPSKVEAWYNDHLPFRSIIYNSNEAADNYIEMHYSDVQNTLAQGLMEATLKYQEFIGQPPNTPGAPETPTGPNEGFEDLIDGTESTEEGVESDESAETEEITETLPPLIVPDESEESEENTETLPPLIVPDESEGSEETAPPLTLPEESEESEETIPEFTHPDDGEETAPDTCDHVLMEGEIITAPTCTEWGVMGYRCEKCNHIVKREYTAKAEHISNEGVMEQEATCTEWGIKAYSCTECGKVLKREYTAKAEHIKNSGTVETEPTCTEYGIMAYSCSACGKLLEREYIAKTEHVRNGGTVELAPTCNAYGIMAYNCVNCGKLIAREYIGKLQHNFELVSDNSKTVLCGSKYSTVEKCSICKEERVKSGVKTHVEGAVVRTVKSSYTTYGYTLVSCADCGGQYRKNISNKKKDVSFALPINRSDDVMEGRYQWLFYRGNNSEAYFCGTNLMSNAELAEYTEVMQQLNDICKAKGIDFQICIWPNKDQVYPEYVTWTVVQNEKRVDRLVKYVQENSDVKIIYPIKELKAAKPLYETYLKYDTHWNCVGGFVGYQEMLRSLGLETMDIKNVPVYEYTGGKKLANDHYYTQISGDMIGLGGLSSSNYKGDLNYYIKYRPDVIVDSLGGVNYDKDPNGNIDPNGDVNGASDTRHTTAANATYDCNFVMLADSYRVMQLGYLEKDFSDCFLTHRSHVNEANVKEAIKNSDILVIAAVERFDYDTLNTARSIIKILSEE